MPNAKRGRTLTTIRQCAGEGHERKLLITYILDGDPGVKPAAGGHWSLGANPSVAEQNLQF